MMVNIEKYFSQEFKDELFHLIDGARKVFQTAEVIDKYKASEEWFAGNRFNNDNRVLNECLEIFFEKGTPVFFLDKENNIEKKHSFIFRVLFNLGKTDYYYRFDKDWL